MKASRVITLSLTLALLCLPLAARADPLIICKVNGIGNTNQAADPLREFLRHLEKAVGIKANSMKGEYHTRLADCLKYIQESKPHLGVLDLGTYLSQRDTLKLKPLAHMGAADTERYHVLVRKGSFKNLASLKGKRFFMSESDATLVSRIILGGKLDLAKDTQLKVKKPLKCLKSVGREKKGKFKGDAALVDEMTYKRRAEIKGLVELEEIYKSGGLPGLTLVVVKDRASKELVSKIRNALPKLCAGAGKKLCKQFQISSFKEATAKTYDKLTAAYGK